MEAGDRITTKEGVDMIIKKVKDKILICELIDYEEASRGMYTSTGTRIVSKDRVAFIQKKLFKI